MPFLDDTGVEYLVADIKAKADATYAQKDHTHDSSGGFVVKIENETMDKTAGEILTMLSNGIPPVFERWSGGYRTYIHTLSYMSIESPNAIYLSGSSAAYTYSTLDDYPSSSSGGGGDN